MKKSNYISIFISILALSVSIGCLCHVLPRELGIDYLGWIVGVLALITAILLGWQIYTLINIKSIESAVKAKYEDTYKKSEIALAEAHMALWVFYCTSGDRTTKEDFVYAKFKSCITAIIHLSRVQEYQIASSYMSSLISQKDNLLQVRIDSELVDILMKDFQCIEHPRHIQGFYEFYSILKEYRKTLG